MKLFHTIDLSRGSICPRLMARKIWAVLYGKFLKHGSIDCMDSFLCDLYALAEYSKDPKKNNPLWWICSKYYTTLVTYDISFEEPSAVRIEFDGLLIKFYEQEIKETGLDKFLKVFGRKA